MARESVLVNEQKAPPKNKDEAWLFQPALTIDAPGGDPVFVGRREAHPSFAVADDEEEHELDMLYREEIEFAVGHGVGVDATRASTDPCRAIRIETRLLPAYEVPRVEAPFTAVASRRACP